jgi:hypothetical protein
LLGEVTMDLTRLEAEARRVYHRYATEVVEALGLCPWAKAARESGEVAVLVALGEAPESGKLLDPTEALSLIQQVVARPELKIGLLLFPRFVGARVEFEHFAARVRELDEARYPRGATPFAIADFHPDAEPDPESPERLVSFIRRTPDPTLQLVRRSVLASVRMTENQGTQFFDPSRMSLDELPTNDVDPLHERIARANQRTLVTAGIERVAALMDEIRSDRDRAYADCANG